MSTEFLKKETVVRHANKAVHGLSAAAILFLYTYFVPKDEYREHCRLCERANDKQELRISETWQATMDNRVAIARRLAGTTGLQDYGTTGIQLAGLTNKLAVTNDNENQNHE